MAIRDLFILYRLTWEPGQVPWKRAHSQIVVFDHCFRHHNVVASCQSRVTGKIRVSESKLL